MPVRNRTAMMKAWPGTWCGQTVCCSPRFHYDAVRSFDSALESVFRMAAVAMPHGPTRCKGATTVNANASVTRLLAAGLILGALGVLIQFLVGVPGFPKVPPGVIILGLCGILVFFLADRWRWILVLGLIAALFVSVGGILEGSIWGRLGDPGDFGPFIGTAAQAVGLLAALISGMAAVAQAFRRHAAIAS
jgi:hypothetical protein